MVQLAFDAVGHNLDDLNGLSFTDGALITDIPVVGNVDYLLAHKLGRPIQNIVIVKVQGVNQIILRLTGKTVPNPSYNRNNAVWVRPSASGTIDVWVS
jgi:ABC-type transporter Mla maintaining outer membrane lipid asymmetry ATPase subunit MlaF